MVQIDEKNRKIIVEIDGTEETLTDMQLSIMDLMKNYNFQQVGHEAETTFGYALELLEELTVKK